MIWGQKNVHGLDAAPPNKQQEEVRPVRKDASALLLTELGMHSPYKMRILQQGKHDKQQTKHEMQITDGLRIRVE